MKTNPVVRSNRRLKHLVFSHYSDGEPECACCGETHLEFLALDHRGGWGKRHRERLRKEQGRVTGLAIYRWVRDNGFPKGFQVLCHNCNQSIGAYGYCPHVDGARVVEPTVKERMSQMILDAAVSLVAAGEYPSTLKINSAIGRNAQGMVIAHRNDLMTKGLWPTKAVAPTGKKNVKPTAKEVAAAKKRRRAR